MSSHENLTAAADSVAEHPHADAIAGLRELADLLEHHPDAPAPGVAFACAYVSDRQELAKVARLLGRAVKSTFGGGTYFQVARRFGPVEYGAMTTRDIACEAKVVGTEPVTETVVTNPARAAELRAELDALTEEVVVGERPVVEWECAPVLRGAVEGSE